MRPLITHMATAVTCSTGLPVVNKDQAPRTSAAKNAPSNTAPVGEVLFNPTWSMPAYVHAIGVGGTLGLPNSQGEMAQSHTYTAETQRTV